MRTIIELPADQIDALSDICAHEGISRAEAIRRAIAAYLQHQHAAVGRPAFGLWRGRKIDGLAHQERLRREWDR